MVTWIWQDPGRIVNPTRGDKPHSNFFLMCQPLWLRPALHQLQSEELTVGLPPKKKKKCVHNIPVNNPLTPGGVSLMENIHRHLRHFLDFSFSFFAMLWWFINPKMSRFSDEEVAKSWQSFVFKDTRLKRMINSTIFPKHLRTKVKEKGEKEIDQGGWLGQTQDLRGCFSFSVWNWLFLTYISYGSNILLYCLLLTVYIL